MARKRQRDEARRLFEKGFYPPDIADELGVPLRTAQRWVKVFRDDTTPKNEQELVVKDVIKESTALIESTSTKCELAEENLDQNWVGSAYNLSNELLAIHTRIRKKLTELIELKLEDPDLNVRLIQGLSQSICRHSELERTFASLEYLDLNRSFKRIESAGFLVLETNQLNEKE